MDFDEIIALQPAWLGIWLNWLFFGAFILPSVLLIWKQTRLTAVITVISSVLAGMGVMWMFGQLGYVKLLGLPHIIFWGPLSLYLYAQIRRQDVPVWPKRVLVVILVTIIVSLAFDVVDVARYLLGERTPFSAGE